ncbi:MAG: transporter, partial [Proteobacteria bacterium]|nr:transporter [Pseudomonadota bacterium]
MVKAFYKSREWALWAYGGGALLFLSLWLQVQMTVAINEWYGGFYDLLQNAASFSENPQVGIDQFFAELIS